METSEKTKIYIESLNNKINLEVYPSVCPKKDKDGYLITLGCSWTYGLGSGYKSGMTQDNFEDICFDELICYENSWRKTICDELNLENINLSLPTSGNDIQFDIAERFFSSDTFKTIKKDKPIYVLWGITSLSRKTLWSNISKNYITFFANYSLSNDRKDDLLRTLYFKTSFDESVTQKEVENKMKFWDYFFEQIGVNNLWFDSFSSNEYSYRSKRMIDYRKKNRDLSYFLCLSHAQYLQNKEIKTFADKNDVKHTSMGDRDNSKIEFLLVQHLVNPYTLHPVKTSHQLIGKFLATKVQELMPV